MHIIKYGMDRSSLRRATEKRIEIDVVTHTTTHAHKLNECWLAVELCYATVGLTAGSVLARALLKTISAK